MSGFSFEFNQPTNFFGNTKAPQASATGGGNGGGYTPRVKPITEGQVRFYLDLCKRHGEAPENFANLSYDELSAKIQELSKRAPKASPEQIKLIQDKFALLVSFGANVKPMSDDDLAKLTGGKEGTASALINFLLDEERKYGDIAPVSDEQLAKHIVPMYLSEVVPFEDYGINRKVMLDEWIDKPDGSKQQLWTFMTPEQFAQECRAKLTRKEASAFIDRHKGQFVAWKATRIRPEQVKYIRQLEDRLANTYKPGAVEFAVDSEGNLTQVAKGADRQWNPQGYQPLHELHLMMFSKECAEDYIARLKYELEAKEMYRYSETSDASDTLESLRHAKSKDDWAVREFTALNDFLFGLEAVVGHDCEDARVAPFHDANDGKSGAAFHIFFDDNVESTRQKKAQIRELMAFALDDKFISFEGMAKMAKDSEVAKEILVAILKDRMQTGDQEATDYLLENIG